MPEGYWRRDCPRDIAGVIPPLAAAVALQLAFAPYDSPCPDRTVRASAAAAPSPRSRRKHHSRTKAAPALASKCLRLELDVRREALLHDFLVRASTETPEFADQRSYRLEVGASVGPVLVTRDFVGSPIIRARVTNLRPVKLSFVLSAQLTSKSGARSGASTVIVLQPHETRSVELLCPDDFTPQSLTWSTMPL
jgi:hypothetical protein